jgi:hypothetical protein
MAKFADDTTVMAKEGSVENSTAKLQSRYLNKRWRIQLTQYKLVHTDFKNEKIKQQPIFVNGTQDSYANTAKYRVMILDARLRWK